MESQTDEERKQQQFISSIMTAAEKWPQNLTDKYSLDELVTGIQYADYKLMDRKAKYDSLLAREKEQDRRSSEYSYIQELKKLTARELNTYFGIAENFETALRKFDYVYGYETNMPEVSAIIWEHKKKEL
ncbi:MAG: hypothetical protein K2L98_03305 [Bacilli bacterium]|nr:hypothetical protein [Bacilli bacterium]